MTAPSPTSTSSFPVARVLAALGLALAPLVALAAFAPAIPTSPMYSAALSFGTAALAIVLHTARAPLAQLATARFALRLAPPGLLFGLLGGLVVARVAPHSAPFEVLSSALNSAGVLLLGTAMGALVGWRVLHPGHLTAVALASSAADLWSVLAPEGVTHHVVAAAVEQRDTAFLRLLTVSAAVPPDRTGEPAIGLGDVAFGALYLAAVTKHGASRSRATAALAVGLALAGAATFALRRALPALPFIGIAVVLLVPEARRIQRKDRGATLLGVALLLASLARLAWIFRPR